ncbi:MAG: indole-3-glycerol phosphate synthase TrpC [Clostridiales bacterium]|jgi:indole-3-glycerol phosphate synthase|nr:indole-3-glycerol phosphate synthase TrpC [Eubacteriales bacterium]MDH7565285.1 indole-3-glycerol phosphate synthase TrpC [Clostridiales bacterium]
MILDKIVEEKKLQLEQEKKKISIEGWKSRLKASGLHRTMDFGKAINRENQISIIGEVKKASPSKGVIKEEFDPLEIAGEYYRAKVEALSVLTEKNYFMGSDEYLVKIRQSFPIPILRKDFVIDIWQVYQSRCLGADAILLIASLLTANDLRRFLVTAGILGMQCLVEVHDRDDLEKALEADAGIIGINNRDLRSFDVDLGTTEKLINHIPEGKIVVSESGIKSPEDIGFLKSLGVNAVLIGEAFMRANSIGGKLDELRAG